MKNAIYGFVVVVCTVGGLLLGPSFVAAPVVETSAEPLSAPLDPAAPRSIEETTELLKNLHNNIEANSRSVDNAIATLPARGRAAWIGAGIGLVVSGFGVTLLSRRAAEGSQGRPVRREGPALKLG